MSNLHELYTLKSDIEEMEKAVLLDGVSATIAGGLRIQLEAGKLTFDQLKTVMRSLGLVCYTPQQAQELESAAASACASGQYPLN